MKLNGFAAAGLLLLAGVFILPRVFVGSGGSPGATQPEPGRPPGERSFVSSWFDKNGHIYSRWSDNSVSMQYLDGAIWINIWPGDSRYVTPWGMS